MPTSTKATYIQRNQILEKWRELILHPLFYPYLVWGLMFYDTLLDFILPTPNQSITLNVISITYAFIVVILFFVIRRKAFLSRLVALMLLLLIAHPVFIINTGNWDARLSIHYVPIAFLMLIGQQNKKLSYKTFILGVFVLLIFFLSIALNPYINIETTSPELLFHMIGSMTFSVVFILIDHFWHRARSYYLTIEKDLSEKIGELTATFSKISSFAPSLKTVLIEFENEVDTFLSTSGTRILLNKRYPNRQFRQTMITDDLEHSDRLTLRTVALSQTAILIGNTSKDPMCQTRDQVYPSLLLVPMLTDDGLIGIMEITHREHFFFNEVHLYFAEVIASICASKILEFGNRQLTDEALELELESQHLQELDELKTHFIENISHDIQQPLQLILGPSEHLLKNSSDTAVLKLARLIHSNGKQLKEIWDQLLEMGELEVTRVQLNIQEADLGRLLHAWAENFNLSAERKQLNFQLAGPGRLKLATDQKKLSSIAHNLINNAIKYTPEKGRVYAEYGYNEGHFFLHVHDSGNGIPEAYRDRVFDRFFRLGEPDGKGTGIGLAIVKELTEILGGSISITDSHLGGACFRFSYNVAFVKGASLPEPTPVLPTQTTAQHTEKPVILVVDDHNDMRQFICSSLSEDFTCIEAEHGKRGLELARSTIPDLIVTDLMMPEMDGESLVSHIRSDERLSHIPVVVLSAKSTQVDKINLYEIGADNYLTKPFETSELRAITHTLIQSRNTLRSTFKSDFLNSPHFEPVYEHQESTFMEKLLTTIEQNMMHPDFNIVQLCSLMHMSRNQLQRKVKALTDMTPVEFVRHTRLKKAATLLQEVDGTATVSEIAYQVGFNNLSYFTRVFKQVFNCTPSSFSKKPKGDFTAIGDKN